MKDWTDGAEAILRKPLTFGLFAFVISGVIVIAMCIGLIPWRVFGGGMWAIMVAVLLGSGLLTLLGLFRFGFHFVTFCMSSIWQAILYPFRARKEKKRLLENLWRVRRDSRMLLLCYLLQPSGRFKAPRQNPAFDDLIGEGLVVTDFDYIQSIVSSSYYGDPYKVNPILFKCRKSLIADLREILSRSYSGDLNDKNVLQAHYAAIVR